MPSNPLSPGHHRAVESSLRARGCSGTILLVEDDEAVREYVRVVLELAGYRVATAEDGSRGLAVYLADPDRYDLLLTDVVMPNATGPELVATIRSTRPAVRAVFMSAYPGGIGSHPVEMPTGFPLLEKPFSIDRLLSAVASALAHDSTTPT